MSKIQGDNFPERVSDSQYGLQFVYLQYTVGRQEALNVREMRACIGRLAVLLEAEGGLVLSRRSRLIARMLPDERRRQAPSHADLRQRMARLETT